jgi:PKHD-type hydroxylase
VLLTFENVLNAEELKQLDEDIQTEDFADGRKTAGWHAGLVKNNTQMSVVNERTERAVKTVRQAIERHADFSRAFRLRAIRPILVSRYTEGHNYGTHVDDPFMGRPNAIRTDLAMTLFLSDTESYEGGALLMESTFGQQRIKLDRGSMVVYPATTLHQVEPVTSGVRLAAVAWAQSIIRDPAHREMIWDLDNARRQIFEKDGKTPAFDLITKTHANLMRMWAEF